MDGDNTRRTQLKEMQLVWQMLLLSGICLCLLMGGARTSNPLEQLALGALSVGGQIMNTMQDGNKATNQLSFDTPLMKIHSKTDIGHGNAMLRPSPDDSDSDSEESDERRRRRRRRKRSPCFNKMPTESADDVEARRKAAAAKSRAANNAARSRIIRTMDKQQTKKTKKKLHRRRRQATGQQQGQQGQQGPNLGDRVKGLWLSFVDNVFDAMQQMRQQIKGAAAQASQAAANN
ncbi:hypothetical protein ACLKA6_013357 [Drosophila palustris]